MLIYALLAVAAVYGIILQMRHRYRIRQEMMQHIHAEQINEAKLQFFINISHEIRTPMSLIISPLQKLMTNDTDHERQKNYRIILAQFRKNPAAGKPIDGYTQDRQRTDVTRFP